MNMLGGLGLILVFSLLWVAPLTAVEPLGLFDNYKYGKLNSTYISALAVHISGELGRELSWFARATRYFSFRTRNGIKMQGYYIPSASSLNIMTGMACKNESLALGGDSDHCDLMEVPSEAVHRVFRPIVLCAGWSESSIAYAKFIHRLHNEGYDVFTYDLRGQGFSDSAVHDHGKVTHVDSFSQYVVDLEHFIKLIVPNQLHYATFNYYADFTIHPIYIGLSLSGLIGLTLIRAEPEIVSQTILIAPCVSPNLELPVRLALPAVTGLGFGKTLAARIDHDDTKILVTHSRQNAIEWNHARDLASGVLKIAGPSFNFLREMLRASDDIIQAAPLMKSSMLIFQASYEEFVDNEAMGKFFSQLGSAAESPLPARLYASSCVGGGSGGSSSHNSHNSRSSRSSATSCGRDGQEHGGKQQRKGDPEDAEEEEDYYTAHRVSGIVGGATGATTATTATTAMTGSSSSSSSSRARAGTVPRTTVTATTTSSASSAAMETTASSPPPPAASENVARTSGKLTSSTSTSTSSACEQVKTSKLVRIAGSYHGLLRESDVIFEQVMTELFTYLS